MHEPLTHESRDVLHIIHNAGFFSCSTIALQEILMFHNEHKRWPDVVDRTQQYMNYKHRPTDNLIPMLFEERDTTFFYQGSRYMTDARQEQQFSDYKLIRFADLSEALVRYFTVSEPVSRRIAEFEQLYNIDYENTVGVFHRANDKVKETAIADDSEYIRIAKQYEGKRFLVVPDHWQFLHAFKAALPNSFYIEANPCMDRDEDKAIFMLLPHRDRPEHALNFLATVIILSKCKRLITHSGNGGFWACLYRGHANNMHQYLNGEWL